MRPVSGSRWASLGASALVLGACAVSAQVPFDQSSPGTYLTYCVTAATGEVFTQQPNCLNSYNELVETIKALISSDTAPYHFNSTQLATLDGLCASSPQTPSCVTQMTNLAVQYIGGLTPPPPEKASACEAEFAPNAALLFQNALPYVCLPNAEGASCLVQTAQALAGAGEKRKGRKKIPPHGCYDALTYSGPARDCLCAS